MYDLPVSGSRFTTNPEPNGPAVKSCDSILSETSPPRNLMRYRVSSGLSLRRKVDIALKAENTLLSVGTVSSPLLMRLIAPPDWLSIGRKESTFRSMDSRHVGVTVSDMSIRMS